MATSDMTGLKRFHDELETMFASSIETEMGFRLLVDWLRTLESDPRVDSSFGVQVGEGDPRHASTRFQYEKPLEELIRDSEEGGKNFRLHRNGVISLTYALWEEEYRSVIGQECGLACKNRGESDVFQDLNRYRQAILHQGARLDRNAFDNVLLLQRRPGRLHRRPDARAICPFDRRAESARRDLLRSEPWVHVGQAALVNGHTSGYPTRWQPRRVHKAPSQISKTVLLTRHVGPRTPSRLTCPSCALPPFRPRARCVSGCVCLPCDIDRFAGSQPQSRRWCCLSSKADSNGALYCPEYPYRPPSQSSKMVLASVHVGPLGKTRTSHRYRILNEATGELGMTRQLWFRYV